ncbi:MAG TPA: CHRD domain-containing protein [Acidimicrobiales bacterium]|nr:CHRD domain-containing protein [Acidimicrobiales bacterium]
MRRTRFLVATVAAAALLAGATTVGVAGNAAADDDDGEGAARQFGALLTGAAEVPGPGDMDGAAAVVVRTRAGSNQVCVTAFATNQIDPPTLFHIHEGDPTVAGPVVVDFVPLLPAGVGCVKVDRKLTRAIVRNPGNYYFNIHNDAFPAGAVRGTLVGF